MAHAVATKNTVTLKGSTATVTEFFQTALSSILYQRGVYPPESFEPKKRYGLTVMVVKDPGLEEYLGTVLQQFKGAFHVRTTVAFTNKPISPCHPYADWLDLGTLQQVVLIIAAKDTREVQERWAFDIQTDKDVITTQCVMLCCWF